MSDSKDLYERLLSYALYLVGRRVYTVHQVREKLQKHAVKMAGSAMDQETGPADSINQVLRRLQDLNYLNDFDYCRSFVRGRCRSRPRGQYALHRELQQKGIPKEVLEQFWSEESLDEVLLAREALEKQLPKLKARYGDGTPKNAFKSLKVKPSTSKVTGLLKKQGRLGALNGIRPPGRPGKSDHLLRQKCYAFLVSRGFSHDTIREVLDGVDKAGFLD